jgi:S-adenosylmethionine-dependent methyltransferase
LQDHLYRRLDASRNTVIPWLSSAKPLSGSRILEIGCGTGSSTVALAEQGADVTGVDVLESSLVVAKDRCEVYDLGVKFHCANATEVHKLFVGQHFDFIIFFASLDHMTHNERMVAMKNTWDMLSPGSLWCVIETPNRLWYYDGHTSHLPFYLWLPDDLAFLYSRFSPRKGFRDLYREVDDAWKLDFLRRGRGVSFHEFELTMKRAEELDVVSSLPIFLRRQNLLRRVLWMLTGNRGFESFLMQCGPKIHTGFYQNSLDLIIRKD